ncbi:hypothetical protein EYF80_030722 [Liparis tanakae]|uniref:Uncharacterized protein n=1 Tax=Liparis tanakae TaxID=230148 RepID=A0A4Z2GZQ3_9TELE|nr:hypothetical protein EYF80_030722 [Liparis tanakae]
MALGRDPGRISDSILHRLRGAVRYLAGGPRGLVARRPPQGLGPNLITRFICTSLYFNQSPTATLFTLPDC